jgi:hypothetical protein
VADLDNDVVDAREEVLEPGEALLGAVVEVIESRGVVGADGQFHSAECIGRLQEPAIRALE